MPAPGRTSGCKTRVVPGVEAVYTGTDLIKDDFPDHTPWSDAQDGPGMSKLNGVVGKPLGDTMCAVEIYETTPFTRIG